VRLCAATCPEDVITLKPQIDFGLGRAAAAGQGGRPVPLRRLRQAVRHPGAIERVVEKLGAKHWMFAGPDGEARLRLLMMCADCRVEAAVNQNFDPHALPPRPRPRTADDLTPPLGAEDPV
jgi:hypothetical protein